MERVFVIIWGYVISTGPLLAILYSLIFVPFSFRCQPRPKTGWKGLAPWAERKPTRRWSQPQSLCLLFYFLYSDHIKPSSGKCLGFRAYGSKAALLLSNLSGLKCPCAAAHNVLTHVRAHCQRPVKCWSHFCSLLFFFCLSSRRPCVWPHL